MERYKKALMRDIILIVASIFFAVFVARSGILTSVIQSTGDIKNLESFIAGIFFTSAFTTAPAIIVLGEIAKTNSLLFTAFFGGIGALMGDLILFMVIRDRFSEDFMAMIDKKGLERIHHMFEKKFFRRFSFFIATLIIISPLPDELGIAIFGVEKAKPVTFAIFSFFANFLGILIIGIIARATSV